MTAKIVSAVAAAAFILALGSANAQEPVKLSDHQLDKVTAGANAVQIPIAAALLANGANGAGGINQFSPSTATVTQTQTALGLNLFTIQ